jgi:CheY-like chemotaxis protein
MDTKETETRATILIVEDDEEIRGYMKRFLEDDFWKTWATTLRLPPMRATLYG